MTDADDSADLAGKLDALGTKLDRVTYLLVGLLVMQVVDVFGGSLVELSLVGLVVLGATFVLLVLLGLARSA